MIWRAGSIVVALRGDRYVLIDATGAITKQLLPQAWAYDEDEGTTTYVVQGGQLRRLEVAYHRGEQTRSEDEVVLDGLVAATDADSARFVEVALGDAAVVEEERQREADRRGQARVDAIDGGASELGYGAEVAAAQAALIHRVSRWADELAGKLLHGLVALARARVDERVILRYAHGCRHACFDRPPAIATEDGLDAAGPPALVELLQSLAGELAAESDYKDWVDARGEASAYGAAAHHVRRAAELLAGPHI